MAYEIVPAEPIFYDCEGDGAGPSSSSSSIIVSSAIDHHSSSVPEPFESERLPPTLAAEIQRFLRVANLVEMDEPRVAFLCKLFIVGFGELGLFCSKNFEFKR